MATTGLKMHVVYEKTMTINLWLLVGLHNFKSAVFLQYLDRIAKMNSVVLMLHALETNANPCGKGAKYMHIFCGEA